MQSHSHESNRKHGHKIYFPTECKKKEVLMKYVITDSLDVDIS